jgi:hypothetical protein
MDGLEDIMVAAEPGAGPSDPASASAIDAPPPPVQEAHFERTICRVCGAPRYGRTLYCQIHKRVVDNMIAMYKRDTENPKALKKFYELRDASSVEPPSEFSSVVLACANDPGQLGPPGKKKPFWDIMLFVERLTAKTTMRKGFKTVLMHKARWLHTATETLKWDMQSAILEWDRVTNETDEACRNYDGPGRALQLYMRVEDFVVGENSALRPFEPLNYVRFVYMLLRSRIL